MADWTCPDCGEVVPLTEDATCPARADRLTRQRCAQLDRACQWASRNAYPDTAAGIEIITSADVEVVQPGRSGVSLLFVDVDGVLNRYGSHYSDRDWPFNHVERECVQQLQRVIDVTGCKLALSSTWRLGRVGQAIKNDHLRRAWGVSWGFVAFTPHHSRVCGPGEKLPATLRRCSEIAAVLKLHRRRVTSWAYVDDLPLDDFGARGVTTAGHVGITEADADRLIELLTTPAPPEFTDRAVLAELEWWERRR